MDWSDKDSFLKRLPRHRLLERRGNFNWADGEQTAEWLRRQTDKYEEEHSSGPGLVCYLRNISLSSFVRRKGSYGTTEEWNG